MSYVASLVNTSKEASALFTELINVGKIISVRKYILNASGTQIPKVTDQLGVQLSTPLVTESPRFIATLSTFSPHRVTVHKPLHSLQRRRCVQVSLAAAKRVRNGTRSLTLRRGF